MPSTTGAHELEFRWRIVFPNFAHRTEQKIGHVTSLSSACEKMSFLESSLAHSLKDAFIVFCGAVSCYVLVKNWLRPPAAAAAVARRRPTPHQPKKKEAAPASSSSTVGPTEATPEGKEEEAKEEKKDEEEEEEEEEEENKGVSLADLAAAYGRLQPKQQLSVKVGAGLLAIGLVYFLVTWVLSLGAGPASIPVDGLGPVHTLPSEHWYKTAHFYTLASFRTREGKEVPYMACQHYQDAEAIHATVLGPKIGASVHADTVTEHGIDQYRARGLLRCVLESKATLRADLHLQRHEFHLTRPMPWNLPAPKGEWLADAPVRHMFLTGSGERLYRVIAMQPTLSKLEPMVVRESELLAAAHNWYFEMIIEARDKEVLEDRPCLCDAHLGIFGSGLSFAYDSEKKEWVVRLDVGVSRNFTKFNDTRPIKYRRNFDFPFKVDEKLRLGTGFEMDPVYHGHVEITFVDPASVSTEVAKRQMLQGLDAPNDELGLAGVVDLTTLNLVPMKARVIDTDCDCTHYCLALTQAIHARLEPPRALATQSTPQSAEL
jgi:hypothetical protein